MSTNQLVLTVNKIDLDKISFVPGPPKPSRIPGINIKHCGQNLDMRIPRMTSTFGASSPDRVEGSPKTNLSMSLAECDPNGKLRADDSNDIGRFYNFLLDLQEKVLEAVIANIKLFPRKANGNPVSERDVRENMKPLIRLHTMDDPSTGARVPSGKYPPTISFKIPTYDNKVTSPIIDNKGLDVRTSPSTLDKVFPPKSEANLIVSPSIYLMAGGACGVSWRIKYAQVFSQPRVTAVDLFADDIEDDEEEEVTPVQAPARELTFADTVVDVEIPDIPEDVTPAPPAPVPETPTPTVRKRRPAAA